MTHPATKRAAMAAVSVLDAPLDLGLVFPPKPGEGRGFGKWTNRDLTPAEIEAMLPAAAAANTRGGNVYIRLGPGCIELIGTICERLSNVVRFRAAAPRPVPGLKFCLDDCEVLSAPQLLSINTLVRKSRFPCHG